MWVGAAVARSILWAHMAAAQAGVCMPGDSLPAPSSDPKLSQVRAEVTAPLGTSAIRLVDCAGIAGLAEPDTITRSPVWTDYDNDGDLDLIFGNIWTPNHVYRNNGDRTFTNVSDSIGINQAIGMVTQGIAVADYDNDGDPDIYFADGAAARQEANFLYRNDVSTTGRFTDVSVESGTGGIGLPELYAKTFTAIWLDFDQDGWLDLFVHK